MTSFRLNVLNKSRVSPKQHGNTEVSEAQLTGNRLFHLLSLLSPYFWLCDLQFSSLFFTLCWFCLFSNVRTHSKISHWIVLNILLLARIPNERKLFFVPLLSLFPTLSLSPSAFVLQNKGNIVRPISAMKQSGNGKRDERCEGVIHGVRAWC